MTSALKSCPFCGGEVSERLSNFGVSLMFFECHDCGATVSFNDDICNYSASVGDYSPSIRAFNKRAEHTCKMNQMTCGSWKCSSCGTVESHSIAPLNEYPYPYCPHCRAKVVE